LKQAKNTRYFIIFQAQRVRWGVSKRAVKQEEVTGSDQSNPQEGGQRRIATVQRGLRKPDGVRFLASERAVFGAQAEGSREKTQKS
jgi:hypothetical protein